MHGEFLTDLVVQREKILDYLLDTDHEDGAGKADFFLGIGFERSTWELLAEALKVLGATNRIAKKVESKHGIKYVVEGRLTAPVGRTVQLRTVWIVDSGQSAARLVTAYPIAEDQK